MIALAERGDRGDFGEIERLGRESLNEMRELLGALRGDGARRSRRSPSSATCSNATRLDVQGERRALPDSVELTAYRIVEHAVAATPAGRVRVTLRYRPDGSSSRCAAPPATRSRWRASGWPRTAGLRRRSPRRPACPAGCVRRGRR